MNATFGIIFVTSKEPSRPRFEKTAPRGDVEAALDEEERCEERERDDAQPLLLVAMLLVVLAHHQAEDECR